MAVTLKEELVVDRWSMLIKDAHGKTEQVYADTEDFIKASEAPGVSWERVEVGSGRFSGTSRTFILVKNKTLRSYSMYIGTRDYGTYLDCSWYLTYQSGFFSRIKSLLFSFFNKQPPAPKLSLFQEQDLRAYATVVHHCFIESIEKITKGTGIEIERQTRGFLGIS